MRGKPRIKARSQRRLTLVNGFSAMSVVERRLGAHNLDYVVEDGEMSATTSRLRERQFKEIVS
jgi:hypothetical protein